MVAYRLYPFVRLFLAFAGGIVFFSYVEWGITLLFVANLIAVVLHFFSSHLNLWMKHYGGVVQLCLIFLLGGLTLQVQDQRRDARFFALGIDDYSFHMAEGIVEEIPKKTAKG